jgi:hypothetical protein
VVISLASEILRLVFTELPASVALMFLQVVFHGHPRKCRNCIVTPRPGRISAQALLRFRFLSFVHVQAERVLARRAESYTDRG